MKQVLPLVLRALLFCFSVVMTQAGVTPFIWTGIGNGWKNQLAPAGTGGEDLVFSNTVGQNIVLPGGAAPTYSSLIFTKDNDFNFTAAVPTTLTLTSGFVSTSPYSGVIRFSSNIGFNLANPEVFDSGFSIAYISGPITGTLTSPLTLQMSADNNQSGFIAFNNPAALNTYTGGTIINSVGSGSGQGVAFWNNSPFGTGPVTIINGAHLSDRNPTHAANYTLSNNFTLINSSSTNPWSFRNWDSPLYLSGTVTLASNAFIAPRLSWLSLPATNNEGNYSLPGPLTRFPTIITGNVSGAFGLTVSGPGLLILQPATLTNTYSGGTTVNGSLVFGNNNAIPATGTVTVNPQGYVGLGDASSVNFATQFNNVLVNKGSGGAIGLDTLPGSPTITYNNEINLSSVGTGATSFTNASIRIGTATSAILAGAITPQGANYQFGNGGGTLYVQSSLSDTAGNGTTVPFRAVMLNNNSSVPLKLYLQGANLYTGGTVANSGFIIFDGAAAVPTTGLLLASGANNNLGNSYIGFTDKTLGGLAPTPSVISSRLATFNQTGTMPGVSGTWGIIGFDSSNPATPVTINGVDLTGFNNGTFLGTSSSAILTGTLTPSTIVNGAAATSPSANNAPNTLRLTAGNGGTLTVNSTLTDISIPTPAALAVVIGSPSPTPAYSDGTVILNSANTYTGGTTVNSNGGITLALGNKNALGAGALNIAPNFSVIPVVGLRANAAGLVIPNPIVFQTPDYTSNFPAQLALVGPNDFTLSGNVSSGPIPLMNGSPADISLYNATPINVTLSGDNRGYFGDLNVVNGTLTFANNTAGINNAAGRGTLFFDSPSASVVFSGSATTELLYGIKGAAGSLVLPTGTNLTINTDNSALQNSNFEFGGVISGAASLTVTSTTTNSDILYLYGHNSYSGGTSITGNGALGLGASDSAGPGLITINTTQGGLALNTGVTLTNPIQFTRGGLAGLGTFAPSSVNGDSSAGRTITFGANQLVFPGIPGNNNDIPGSLTIATNVSFTTGGGYHWTLQDPTASDGHSQLLITGNLDLATISGPTFFTLSLGSLDANGKRGFDPLIVWGNSYSFAIVTTTGSINMFNASNFMIDSSQFQNGLITPSAFSITNPDSTHLYLNFTAIPEPSTWALLATGAGLLGLAALRKSRRSC